ncbi:MAG TPA: hypothetical protein VNO70_27250 [Blastocatellia bacterium]|nr:hypothetical protein [Blastocatellia bacterium]
MDQLDNAILQEFKSRLEDAIAWCSSKLPYSDMRNDLRTKALKPEISEWPSSEELDASLAILARQRRLLLSGSGMLGKTAIRQKDQGKLLVCEFNFSFSSGESEAETYGFFDIHDRPPWDTWAFSFQKKSEFHPGESFEYLVSWVPLELVSLVQRGIMVNPYECIYWASNSPDKLVRQLNGCALLDE